MNHRYEGGHFSSSTAAFREQPSHSPAAFCHAVPAGGFQVFSLAYGSIEKELKGFKPVGANLSLSTVKKITEDGVVFKFVGHSLPCLLLAVIPRQRTSVDDQFVGRLCARTGPTEMVARCCCLLKRAFNGKRPLVRILSFLLMSCCHTTPVRRRMRWDECAPVHWHPPPPAPLTVPDSLRTSAPSRGFLPNTPMGGALPTGTPGGPPTAGYVRRGAWWS